MENDKKKIKPENYITIQGWMITELNLKGNELIVYAIIYGFTQKEEQKFRGGLQYLADWANSTKETIRQCLKSLVLKELIEKEEIFINNVKFCEYHTKNLDGVYKKLGGGYTRNLVGGIQETCSNNIIDINNNINIKENKQDTKKQEVENRPLEEKKERKKENSEYDKIINSYTTNEDTKQLLYEWLKVRKMKKALPTNKALELNLKRLEDYAKQSKLDINKYLEEVIIRGWLAFYPIENKTKQEPVREERPWL